MYLKEAIDNLYVCATNAKNATLEEGYYEKCFDRVIAELEKKDKIIDLMAEDIIEYEQDLKYEELYKDTEEVIEYYKKVVEDK